MTVFNKNSLNDQDNYSRNYPNETNSSLITESPVAEVEFAEKQQDEFETEKIPTVIIDIQNASPGPRDDDEDDDDDDTLIPIEGDEEDDLSDDDDDDILSSDKDDDDLLDDDEDDDLLSLDDDDLLSDDDEDEDETDARLTSFNDLDYD